MQIHKETIESKRGGQQESSAFHPTRKQEEKKNMWEHSKLITTLCTHQYITTTAGLSHYTDWLKIQYKKKLQKSQNTGKKNRVKYLVKETTTQTQPQYKHTTHTHSHPPACKHPWHKHQLTNHNQINQDKTQAKQPGCHSSGCILPQTKQSQQPFHVQLPAKHRKVSYSQ